MKKELINLSICLIFLSQISSPSCSKANSPAPIPVVTDTTVKAPVDPVLASTIGFFLDNWQPKTFVAPTYTSAAVPDNPSVVVVIDASDVITKIPQTIFGHNANNWMWKFNNAQFLSEIKDLNPHVIRFPAGSGSEGFFWNQVNQPPADAPTYLVNADGTTSSANPYTYGKTTNNWQATLDDYYTLLSQTNSVGLLTMNYGYARYGTGPNPAAAAAHLAADWVRYDNGRTLYWEIGNENYGTWEWGYRINTATNQDSQPEYLTGALYAQHFRIFCDSMRAAAAQIGKTIYIGAVMHESAPQSWDVNTTRTWNSGMLPGVNNQPDFYIGHNYFTPYNTNIGASAALNCADSVPAAMMNYMTSQFQQYGATLKPITMGEWNMSGMTNYALVSNTSGSFAVIVQGENIKNKFGLSARWDLYNGWGTGGNDMGLFSNGDSGEPGAIPQWTARPSLYYMYYFQKCIGDRLVSDTITGSKQVKAYASTFDSGQASVALVNTSGSEQTVQVNFKNFRMGGRYYWYSLAGSTDNGEYSRKVGINGVWPTIAAGGPSNYTTIKAYSAVTSNGIRVTIEPWSTVFVMVDKN